LHPQWELPTQIDSLCWQRLQTQCGLRLNHGPTRFVHVEQTVYHNAGGRFLFFGIAATSIWFGDYLSLTTQGDLLCDTQHLYLQQFCHAFAQLLSLQRQQARPSPPTPAFRSGSKTS
jgi:hypothetical protein